MDIEKMKADGVAIRESGFNCAQGVLCACREYTGLDDKLALSISGHLGGGVGSGEICGCITGGLMAVGMVAPFLDNTKPEDKKAMMNRSREFVKAFNSKYGACRCCELKAKGYNCAELVAFGVETAAKIIEENK